MYGSLSMMAAISVPTAYVGRNEKWKLPKEEMPAT